MDPPVPPSDLGPDRPVTPAPKGPMPRTRRRPAALAAALALVSLIALIAAGCGGSSDGGLTHLTVALDWTPNTNHSGVYIAKDDGYYRDAGLDVTVVEPDPSGALPQLAAGNADIAFSYAEQIIPARADGSKVVSIASVMRTNTSSLVSPADRDITRPRDLAGKTYGTFGGDIERPLVDALVRCDGGDPSTIRFVDVGNVDYAVGFRRRQFDFTWVFDGWDVIRMRDVDGMDVRTIPFRDHLRCIPDWYTPVLAATETTIAKDPEVLRRFLAATAKGYERAVADPAAAAEAIKRAAPESDMALLAPSARFVARFLTDARGGWGYQEPSVWKGFNAFLARSSLPHVADVAGTYTNDLLPSGS